MVDHRWVRDWMVFGSADILEDERARVCADSGHWGDYYVPHSPTEEYRGGQGNMYLLVCVDGVALFPTAMAEFLVGLSTIIGWS